MPSFSPLSLNKKVSSILFPLCLSINDIRLNMSVYVAVKMLILYSNNNEFNMKLERAESVVSA